MQKNVFLRLLIFCAVLTLSGGGVLTAAENQDGLIKTGYYVWKVKMADGSIRSEKLYIKASGKNLDFYTERNYFFKATITGNNFDGLSERGRENAYINGAVDTKGLVAGYYENWDVFEPNKKSRFEFVVQQDTSPEAKAYWEDYFKGLAGIQAKYESLLFPKASASGRRMRAGIAKIAKEENVSFVVRGKTIDSTGHPVEGVVIGLSARMHDPDGPAGMTTKDKYVTSNKDGFFESEVLSGYLLTISYEGKEYQRVNESLRGKKELLMLKDNPIIIKLEPYVKSK